MIANAAVKAYDDATDAAIVSGNWEGAGETENPDNPSRLDCEAWAASTNPFSQKG